MALILQIRAETKAAQRQIETAAKKAGASVKRLEKTSAASASKMSGAFGGVGKMLGTLGIGLGIGIALRGIKSIISETITFTDQIGKLSTRLGESTEFLSEMGFVAERSGVTFQAMSVGIQRANRRMAEAREGFGEAKKVLEELDLELNNTDGSARNFEQILPDLADKINGLSSEQDKLRIAFKLFDTEGVSFLQFLKSGSGGIEQLRTEARSLGLSLDKDATDRAAQAADALTDFQGATKGLTTEIVLSLLPALSDWTEGMTTLITGFDQARIRAKVWAEDQESNTAFLDRQILALESQASKLKASGVAYITAGKETEAYKETLDLLVATEGLEIGSLDSVNKLLAETIRLRKQAKEEGDEDGAGIIPKIPKPPPDVVPIYQRINVELQQGVVLANKSRGENEEIWEFAKRQKEVYGGIIPQVEQRVNLEDHIVLLTKRQLLAQNQVFNITSSITTALADAVIQGQDLLQVMEQIAKQMASRALAGLFGGVVSSVLGLGFGSGFSLVSGFQHGGSFKVGGSGGADSQTVAFRASPGERVDVTPRNQPGGAAAINNHFHFPNVIRLDDETIRSKLIPAMNRLRSDENLALI